MSAPRFAPFIGERIAVVGLGKAGLPAARRGSASRARNTSSPISAVYAAS